MLNDKLERSKFSDLIFIFDLEGCLIGVGGGTAELLGYREDELIGKRLHEILRHRELSRPKFLFNQISEGALKEEVAEVWTKSEEALSVSVSGSFLKSYEGAPQGFILSAKNNHSVYLLEQMRQQKFLFESVIENMGDGLIVSGKDGEMLVFNGPARKIVGSAKNIKEAWESVLEIFGELESGYDPIEIHPLAYALAGNSVDNQEVILRGKSEDSSTYLSCSSRPIRNLNGEVTSAIVVFRDVSTEKVAEEELDKTRMKLVQSEKMAALTLMSGGAAHEINNPLAIINASCELLKQMSMDGILEKDMLLESLDQIIDTTFRITRIVRGLKTLARDAESDEFASTSVMEIIEDATILFQEKFKRTGIQFSIENVDKELSSAKIECRKAEISQVLMSLVGNAIDAIKDQAGEHWVRIQYIDDGEFVRLKVLDSGEAIPKEFRDQIMLPFFTTKEVGQGTGLGLSVSQSIIEAHSGTLSLAEGPITCFEIRIPKMQNKKKSFAA